MSNVSVINVNQQRESGKKAQIANITAAKVRFRRPAEKFGSGLSGLPWHLPRWHASRVSMGGGRARIDRRCGCGGGGRRAWDWTPRRPRAAISHPASRGWLIRRVCLCGAGHRRHHPVDLGAALDAQDAPGSDGDHHDQRWQLHPARGRASHLSSRLRRTPSLSRNPRGAADPRASHLRSMWRTRRPSR